LEDNVPYNVPITSIDFAYYLDYSKNATKPEVYKNLDRYVDLSFKEHYIEFYSSTTPGLSQSETATRINTTMCSADRYLPTDVLPEYIGITNGFTCLDLDNITYDGSFASNTMKYYWLSVNKCTADSLAEKGLNTTCANDTEMNDVLENSFLIFNVLTEYFDSTEVTISPIKRQSRIYYFNYLNN
jgi:hypothetical protein